MIKILIDMNLPPKWVELFNAEGWEAIHEYSTGVKFFEEEERNALVRLRSI